MGVVSARGDTMGVCPVADCGCLGGRKGERKAVSKWGCDSCQSCTISSGVSTTSIIIPTV